MYKRWFKEKLHTLIISASDTWVPFDTNFILNKNIYQVEPAILDLGLREKKGFIDQNGDLFF